MKEKYHKKRLIVVLGMHRSGTSAITRSLQVLGVELGDNLIGAIVGNNDKGFFEDVDINSFNNEILQSIGSDWSFISTITSNQYEQLYEQGFFLRAVELLREKFEGKDIFAFKDPRVAKLLPFWKEVFSHLGYDIRYVLALRHPLSVAKSLSKRDGFILTHSYWLWLSYVLESLRNSKGKSRLIVDFDRLIQAPQEQLQRIAETCQLEIDESEFILFKESFLDAALCHTVYEPNDLHIDKSCPELVQEVFNRLSDIAAGKYLLEESLFENDVVRWSAEFEKLKKTFGCIDQQVAYLSTLRETVQSNEEQIIKFKHEAKCLEVLLYKRESELVEMNEQLQAHESQLAEMNERLQVRESQLAEMNEILRARESQLAEISQLLQTYEYKIAGFGKQLQDYENENSILKEQIHVRDNGISSLAQLFSEKNDKCTSLENEIVVLSNHVKHLMNISSWLKFRCFVSRSTRSIWQNLPVSTITKIKIKKIIFKYFPFFFENTVVYQTWKSSQTVNSEQLNQIQQDNQQDVNNTIQTYVPLLQAKPLAEKSARVICFYLPQFHSFPENDNWWGKGFTEWTNVVPAKPQFLGHYQPHVPGELGYYNLLDPVVQKRQVELAKLYGIEGFCFYFYWFAGHRLMEEPIRNYLNDSTLDLPFCLCWANENWSRRWDGLENDVLIAQDHSPEDDIAFISHISDYLKDARYIRIDGKPVLLIYRPNLLPSAKDTVARWRKWCRENGVGEIYLAYTQSFESVNPKYYNFDAAIEFPPNNMNLSILTDQAKPIVDNFQSNLFDWQEMVRRSKDYEEPGYKLFRGVNPSWDNTARRKNKGNILLNSNPCEYQEWLYNAINHTCIHFTNPDERLVFVNAWNEWAEGAHLEPDQRYGYAYLEATRTALIRSGIKKPIDSHNDGLAIIVHAFYKDVFLELLARFVKIKNVKFKLFVTTPSEQYLDINLCLKDSGLPFHLLAVENRGRDVLPFLKIMKYILNENFEYILKLHTKKSLHRRDGEVWRNDLYDKLTSNNAVFLGLKLLKEHVDIGIVAPDGHLVPMNYYWGSNSARVLQLASRLGQDVPTIEKLQFAAGTMFYARVAALIPLINLAISDSDFELESGQIDGTFAHALERSISISCHAAGLKVVDTSLSEEHKSGKEYIFAEASPA